MDFKSIDKIENYNNTLEDTDLNITTQYLKLIDKYNYSIIKLIKIHNHTYFKYVFLKGIESLTYVFYFLLFYTKNLNMTYHHSEKALFYYIEFIGQIGDDNHSFLQLSSKDAVLFIYKKTIFEISENARKENKINEKEKGILDNIQLITNIYKNMINIFVNTNNLDNMNEVEERDELYLLIFSEVNDLFIKLSKKKYNNIQSLTTIHEITKILLNKKYDLDYHSCSLLFKLITKQYEKKNNKLQNILNNIKTTKFDDTLSEGNFTIDNLIL